MMKQRIMALAGAAAAALLSQGAAHAEVSYSFATGLDYSSGDYGATTSTEVWSVPFVARAVNGPWAVRVSTAYLEISGPADVADSDGGGSGAAIARTSDVRGIGDTNLAVSRTFSRLAGSDAYFEATGRVRLPTGDDEKGLGVGETDYGLSGEVGVNQRGGGASVELTRRFLSDHGAVEREDGWQVNTAAWIRPTQRSQVGAFGYWREASTPTGEDPAQIGAFVSYQLTSGLRMNVTASGGLSDASADYAAGVRLTWRPDTE